LMTVGPFVCIGRPNDNVSPLGAARHYVHVGRWQDSVLKLLNSAALVVLLVGHTKGLKWELDQCRHIVDPRRTIILVPDNRRLYAQFRAEAKSELGISLPVIIWKWHFLSATGLIGFIRFDPAWRGIFIDLG